jgi:cobalt-zinc-cadmium efflux system membrane fusion protein
MKKLSFIIGLFLFFYSCSFNTSNNNTSEENKKQSAESSLKSNIVQLTNEQLKNINLKTQKPEIKELKLNIKLTGKIDVPPQNRVTISVPLGGYLKSTHLIEGMHIKKGEVLAVIEDLQYIQLQQDYLTAQAQLKYLENEYKRQKELNANNATSEKLFEKTESEYSTQRILIKSLSEKLQLLGINPQQLSENTISKSIKIYSPIDGYVSTVNQNIGKYIMPGEILFELINPDDIHLALTVFEKDIDKLFIGQKVVAYTTNNPEKKYPCEVILIGKDLAANNSVMVHCHFDKYDPILLPGTFMVASAEYKAPKTFVISSDAVVSDNNQSYLFTQTQKNTFKLTPIQVLNSQNNLTWYSYQTNVDDTAISVVTNGAYYLWMVLKNEEE